MMGRQMKLAVLAVSLLVAVGAAVGSLLSHSSRSSVANDILVLELSQKLQDQEAKLNQTEETLRQFGATTWGGGAGVDRSGYLSRVANLQTKMQQIDSEDYRLNMLREQLMKEQERLDAWQKQSDLTKYRLDQDEKVLGLEVMAQAIDDKATAKSQSVSQVAVVASTPTAKRVVDLHGETPFELPKPVVHAAPDYSTLQARLSQLQAEQKQWVLDQQALVQAKSQLKRELSTYNNDVRAAAYKRQKLEDENRSLKQQGLTARAKS